MFGCFSNTFTSSANSFLLYTEPVGLQGVLNRNAFVLEVIAFSTCSAVTLKSASTVASITIGVPSAILTIWK